VTRAACGISVAVMVHGCTFSALHFPNSATTGLDRSPEILACARKQNPGARFVLVDEKNISEVLLTGDFNVALLRFSLQAPTPSNSPPRSAPTALSPAWTSMRLLIDS